MKNKWAVEMIEWYQKKISPNMQTTCRHTPSCSQYGKECFERFNFFKASFLTAKRILTCNPLFKPRYDPAPESKKAKDLLPTKRLVLVSAFTAFNQEPSNISSLVLSQLPEYIHDAKIIGVVLDTSFSTSFDTLIDAVKQWNPDTIIMLGEAKKRYSVTLESQAKNTIHTEITDNDGVILNGLIDPTQDDMIQTSVDVDTLCSHLTLRKYPAERSDDCGSFVCNYLYYKMLSYAQLHHLPSKILFVHLPKSFEQSTEDAYYPYQTRLLKDVIREIIRIL